MNTKLAFLGFAFAVTFLAPAFADAPTNTTQARQVRASHRGELRRFLRSLEATESQRSVALEQARAAAPIARAARTEGRAIRVEALREHPGDRGAARASARPRIRDLRERTLASLRPLAQKVLGTLSPDQRKKLEDSARARGKELDEARLEKVVSWLLTRPGVHAQLGKAARR